MSISHLIGRPPGGGEVFVARTTVGLTTVSAVGLLLRLLSVSPPPGRRRRGVVRRTPTLTPVSRPPTPSPTPVSSSSHPPLLTAVAGSGAAVALVGAGVTATTATASGPLPRVRTLRGHCVYIYIYFGVGSQGLRLDCGCFDAVGGRSEQSAVEYLSCSLR